MNKLNLLALVASTFLLGGCQNMLKTMVAHITISKHDTAFVANGNAATNFCLSKNMIDKQIAYDFSITAEEFLGLVVFDNNFYKTTYENSVSELYGLNLKEPSGAAQMCEQLKERLPAIIANLRRDYNSYARELGVARSEENQRLAQQMANFRAPTMPNIPAPQTNFPNFGYSQEQSKTQTYLINTNSGINQCRVTKNNFVFCM